MESLTTQPRKQSLSKAFLSSSPPRSAQSRETRTRPDSLGDVNSAQNCTCNGQTRTRNTSRKTGLPTTLRSQVPASHQNEDNYFDADDGPTTKLDMEEIQVLLYRRKCDDMKITPVGAFLRHPNASVLNIKNYCLGPQGALALSVPLTLDSHVTHLNLEGNAIGTGIRYLELCFLDSVTLTHLNLNHNDVGSVGASVMGRVLMDNRVIESVKMAGNNLKDEDAFHLTRVLYERKPLRELDISQNNLGDLAATKLGHALVQNDYLETLDVSWNNISSRGGQAIMEGLKENIWLKRLYLSFNGLGDTGCVAAGKALAVNSTLLELDLAGNRIMDMGLASLANQLKHNETLTVLKLGDNLATGLGAQAVGQAVLQAQDSAITVLDLTNINVYDSLVTQMKERTSPAPIQFVHGTVSREQVPLEELEKKFMREVNDLIAAREAREAAERLAMGIIEDTAPLEEDAKPNKKSKKKKK